VFSGKIDGIEYVFALVKLPSNWSLPHSDECVIQFVDPKKVFGEKHILHCILLTERAFRNGTNVASSPEIEFLLRLSGTRQINKAIKQLSPGSEALVVVFGENAKKCYENTKEQIGWTEIKGFKLKSQPEEKDAMERAVLLNL